MEKVRKSFVLSEDIVRLLVELSARIVHNDKKLSQSEIVEQALLHFGEVVLNQATEPECTCNHVEH